MDSLRDAREVIVALGRRLYERGLLAGTDGNLSIRLADGSILVTPSGAAKGFLAPDSLVVVDAEGRQLSGAHRPSSECAMHLAVYRARPDVGACVHSHAPHATAFAVAGEPLPEDILPEVVLFVGPIALAGYAPPGTDAVPASLTPFFRDHNAFLLQNHGLLTLGADPEEAYNRHETVEHYARILLLARQLGTIARIPDEDFRRLTDLRRRSAQPWAGGSGR